MPARAQADAVLLQPVTRPGLRDPSATLDLGEESGDVDGGVLVEITEEAGEDTTEQDAAEAGRRLARQIQVAQRDPASRRDGTGVVRLQFGQDHVDKLPVRVRRDPSR